MLIFGMPSALCALRTEPFVVADALHGGQDFLVAVSILNRFVRVKLVNGYSGGHVERIRESSIEFLTANVSVIFQ